MHREARPLLLASRFRVIYCCVRGCGVVMPIPSDLILRFLADPTESFFCLRGHAQHFTADESQSSDDLERRRKQWHSQLAARRARLRAEQDRIDRKRNAWTPCTICNRTFRDLPRHVAAVHRPSADRVK